jgi:hypothetical protein
MEMKGFVITLDSIVALLLMLILLLTITSTFSTVSTKSLSDVHLRQISFDTLTILEKSSMLNNAIKSNSSAEISSFLSRETPNNVCMLLKIFRGQEANFIIAKGGCKQKSEFQLARRSFVVGNDFYFAEISTWNR